MSTGVAEPRVRVWRPDSVRTCERPVPLLVEPDEREFRARRAVASREEDAFRHEGPAAAERHIRIEIDRYDQPHVWVPVRVRLAVGDRLRAGRADEDCNEYCGNGSGFGSG